MSYTAMAGMRQSQSLIQRITACAAKEGVETPADSPGSSMGVPGPDQWVIQNLWALVTQPGWSDAWKLAEEKKQSKFNPDTGARDDVITDTMILSAVQALKGAQA